jgi:hypothetical protein
MNDETVLTGGNLSTVVRVGDTVRRNTGSWTPAIHAVLAHLASRGFAASPRALGIDNRGREILTFVPGDVYPYPMPPFVWEDETLRAIARLMRELHDATRDFTPPSDSAWRVQPGAPSAGPVICHNDIAPYNTVFRGTTPVAFIDWDLATPSPPLWDLAYAAWFWVPLYEAGDIPPLDRPARLRLLCDAYGLDAASRAELLDTVRRREQVAHDVIVEWAATGVPGFDRMLADGHHLGKLDAIAWLDAHRAALDAALV